MQLNSWLPRHEYRYLQVAFLFILFIFYFLLNLKLFIKFIYLFFQQINKSVMCCEKTLYLELRYSNMNILYLTRDTPPVIFDTPLVGVLTPPVERRHPPPTQCNFCFFLFFDVNLRFAHVYTPPNICRYPPNFKFLEITLYATSPVYCVHSSSFCKSLPELLTI